MNKGIADYAYRQSVGEYADMRPFVLSAYGRPFPGRMSCRYCEQTGGQRYTHPLMTTYRHANDIIMTDYHP